LKLGAENVIQLHEAKRQRQMIASPGWCAAKTHGGDRPQHL